jgi:hypothetical protein
MINKILVGTLMAAVMAAAPASAVIMSGTLTGGTAFTAGGVFVKIANPVGMTVGIDSTNSSNVFGFDERRKVTLSKAYATQVGGIIAKGAVVNSHYLFFDAPTNAPQTAIGTVTFKTRILGICSSGGCVGRMNPVFGLPSVTYTIPASYALESSDSVSFSGKTLSYNLRNGIAGDNFRVLTAVPEASTWAMLIAGFGMVGASARRRRSFGVVTA